MKQSLYVQKTTNPDGYKVSKGHPALYIIEIPKIEKNQIRMHKQFKRS
jgi:hypothetical protein